MRFKSNIIIYAYSPFLVVLGAYVVYQGLQLKQLTEVVDPNPLVSSVESLEQQQETLRTEWESFKNVDFVTATQHESDKLEISNQLVALQKQDQDAGEWLSLRKDLTALSAEVEVIEQGLKQLKSLTQERTSTLTKPAQQTVSTAKSRDTAPPFTLVGVEHRGGEPFLAVSPDQNTQLSDIHLMRTGDTQSGWHLLSLESGKAQFTLPNGRRQALIIK
ncbi:hypothetical protein [Pseudomonas sp. NA-150]|uniref:hypothetical protein n=1 Tax=Pseudomonas sp. NA-150 TaxID=3367525 RepID=UPI0037C53FC7